MLLGYVRTIKELCPSIIEGAIKIDKPIHGFTYWNIEDCVAYKAANKTRKTKRKN